MKRNDLIRVILKMFMISYAPAKCTLTELEVSAMNISGDQW
jgi:hypothetical protein